MKAEDFKREWDGKYGAVIFNDGSVFRGKIYITNPADNEEEEGDTVFIQIWQPDRIIEDPIDDVEKIDMDNWQFQEKK